MRKSPDVLSKGELSSYAEIFKALAHPTRLAILNSLLAGPKCVTDVCELCAVSQPNISQHLTLLRHEGIVKFYDEGKSRCYYLPQPKKLKAILLTLGQEESEFTPACRRPRPRFRTRKPHDRLL